jgi:hypothetical protein
VIGEVDGVEVTIVEVAFVGGRAVVVIVVLGRLVDVKIEVV